VTHTVLYRAGDATFLNVKNSIQSVTPLVAVIQSMLLRDLDGLRRELARYPDEASLWQLPDGLPNSGGTLALHLAGNLQHYIGAQLGRNGYVRDREREFTARGVPRADILREIDAAEQAVRATLPRLTEEQLQADFPEILGDGYSVQTGAYLIQLAVHFAYHLGQVSYHRRLATGDSQGVNAVATSELSIVRPAT
jgi:hypothetical protein